MEIGPNVKATHIPCFLTFHFKNLNLGMSVLQLLAMAGVCPSWQHMSVVTGV